MTEQSNKPKEGFREYLIYRYFWHLFIVDLAMVVMPTIIIWQFGHRNNPFWTCIRIVGLRLHVSSRSLQRPDSRANPSIHGIRPITGLSILIQILIVLIIIHGFWSQSQLSKHILPWRSEDGCNHGKIRFWIFYLTNKHESRISPENIWSQPLIG